MHVLLRFVEPVAVPDSEGQVSYSYEAGQVYKLPVSEAASLVVGGHARPVAHEEPGYGQVQQELIGEGALEELCELAPEPPSSPIEEAILDHLATPPAESPVGEAAFLADVGRGVDGDTDPQES